MVLISQADAFESYFKIVHGHGYNDPSKYREQITMEIPGASTAWRTREVGYLPQAQLRTDLDPDIKHLWSSAIKDRSGKPVAILNIDNIADDKISNNIIEDHKTSINQLCDIISVYWELQT